jgi:hypothetical protein
VVSQSNPNIMNALKLGTQTGSLFNHLISGSASPAPVVGLGATILAWTDRRAATITEVSPSGKRIGVVEDIATAKHKGMTDPGQEWDLQPGNPQHIKYFSLRKNGAWVREGETAKGGQRISLGHKSHFYDYSF